jgi:hypothetical protein
MVSCYLQGGLGNYMFQISATYSLALDNRCQAVFNDKKYFRVHKSLENYKENIFRNVVFNNDFKYDTIYQEPYFSYKPIPFKKNIYLNGYFQSEKYFIHNRDKILELFSPREEDKKHIQKKYGSIIKNKSCSIHVRRGDYLKLKNHHPLCDMDYYEKSINLIGKDKIFLIFSDDIVWCKNNFKNGNFVFVENEKDYIDLYLMSMCDNNIIANSSFSWWGAWLNQNINKTVIIPSKWFGSSKNNLSTKDIYTEKCKIL